MQQPADRGAPRPPRPQVYLGRQPVLDRHCRTWGYELLYRDGGGYVSGVDTAAVDGVHATKTVIERTLLEWGLDHVAGGRPVLINVDASFLQSGLVGLLPKRDVVLELLEDIVFDVGTVEAVVEAHRHGYRFALDDVTSDRGLPPAAVRACAELVKVDLPLVSDACLPALVRDLRDAVPHAQLLAEKVETVEEFEHCTDLGFDLFQGYFFARPERLSRAARPVNSAAALALIVEVQQPNVTLERLEELVSTDPTLAFRLLTLVNSSLSGLLTRVESVHQAIVLLGIDKVRQLATLIAIATKTNPNEELLLLAATRARMGRLIAPEPELGGPAFMVGLLSVIDVLFQQPMEELLDELPLAPPVAAALRDGQGVLGATLAAIRAYETADVASLEQMRPGELEAFRLAYGDSLVWATEFCRQAM